MDTHFAFVNIEGNHLDRIAELLTELDYRLVGPPARCTSGAAAIALLNEESGTVVRKAAYESNGWTCLIDPEMIVITSDVELTAFAQAHATRILVWICESYSDTYGFRLFAPTLQRDLLAAGGELVTDTGNSLPEERGIDWQRAGYQEMLTLVQRFGVAYDRMTADRPYWVYSVELSDTPAPELPSSGQAASTSRPWWRFW
jgi:hypothetical protein